MINTQLPAKSKHLTQALIVMSILLLAASQPISAQELPVPAGPDSFFIGEKLPINLTPNYAHIFYGKNSIKEAADTRGVYGYVDSKLDLFEFAWDILDLQFKDQTHLTQNDYTIAYTNYWIENWKLRSGVHYIDSTSEISDAAYITFWGAHYYELDSYDVGADLSYSRYDSNIPEVDVFQVAPHLGWYWAKSDEWSLRTDLTGYYIHTDADLDLGSRDFYSGEGRITAGSGATFVSLFGWVGRQTFAVKNNGFVVYNLSELHEGGYGGDITYKFTENTSLKGFINNLHFNDFVIKEDSFQLVTGLAFSMTF